jgi:intraflagellar transport protein 46
MQVRSIENADKNPKEIMKWIQSVADVHKSKPPPAVHYSKPMPDIERLMQEWPPSFEELLKEVCCIAGCANSFHEPCVTVLLCVLQARLPGADLDMSVEEYARTICAMLDIPVYGSLVQSLHVFFTLYDEFKSNKHFANLGATAGGAAADASRAVDALLGESDGKDGR